MYILDTDILTLLFAGHEKVSRRWNQVPSSQIAITIVSQFQSLLGRFHFLLKAADGKDLLRAQTLLDATARNLAQVESIFPVDPNAAAEFDRLCRNKKLKKIGRADILIAAISLARGATLVSRNLRDFRQVPGLKFENWAD